VLAVTTPSMVAVNLLGGASNSMAIDPGTGEPEVTP